MINWIEFNNAHKYYGNEIICEIIDMFEFGDEGENNGYVARLSALKNAIEQKDFISINKIAHSLAGVLGNFYDPVAVTLGKNIEKMGKEQTEEHLAETFAEFESAVHSLFAELDEFRKKNK